MTEKTERNKASSEVVRQSDLALLTDVQAALQQEKHHALFLMVIFLLVLAKPVGGKLERIKTKYGL